MALIFSFEITISSVSPYNLIGLGGNVHAEWFEILKTSLILGIMDAHIEDI
jgi:hypothetical protein